MPRGRWSWPGAGRTSFIARRGSIRSHLTGAAIASTKRSRRWRRCWAGAVSSGLGECGLDYHYELDPAPVQIERFRRQLLVAERLGLPVVVHVREAHDDMAAILADHPHSHGIIHSFTAGPAEAERYLALGWHLGFNGVATFRNAPEVREAARLAPRDRILIETDSPYLAPVPHRGKRCEPAYVTSHLACLAAVRECDPAELAAATTRNARRLFGLGAGETQPGD